MYPDSHRPPQREKRNWTTLEKVEPSEHCSTVAGGTVTGSRWGSGGSGGEFH